MLIAPPPAPVIAAPAPVPAESAPVPAPVESTPAPVPAEAAPAPVEGAVKPPQCGPGDESETPAEGAATPAETPAAPAADPAAPAETPAAPVEEAAKPAEAPVAPAEAPKPVEAPKPEPFGVKTVTFTSAAAPEDIKKISAGQGDTAASIIFAAKLNDAETWIEAQGQEAYCFFQVTGIETAAILPLDQVKQKISDKLKADKITAALKAAADSARSNILEEIKAGKSFTEAAAAKAMLTATMLPEFSKEKPLPAGTANSQVITGAVTGEAGMGGPPQPGLQAGELSEPLEVPEGLLLVYVEKKELPKHPDMEQKKKELAGSRTFRNAAGKMPDFQGPGGIEAYIQAMQYFRSYGSPANPVLKAWFAARRADAQTVQ